MRKRSYLWLGCLTLSSASSVYAQDASSSYARAFNESVDYIEARAVLPEGAAPLHSYARYYTNDPDHKDSVMAAYILTDDLYLKSSAGVYIVPFQQFPWVTDGTCATNIDITYYHPTHNISVCCKGHCPPPPEN